MLATLLLIFVLQVAYVSVVTMRTILTVKGYRYLAAMLSCIDVFIYVIAFKMVMDNLQHPINLLVYCLGYSIGILVGVKIEERLAIGYINVQVISRNQTPEMVAALRKQGYGVTTWSGEGLEGTRQILSIVTQRKNQSKLYKAIRLLDPESFLISYEPKQFQGGFILKSLNALKLKGK